MNGFSAQPFSVEVLFWPALFILVVGFWISLLLTRSPLWSGLVAFIKSGLFLVYYGFFFDGTFTFFDDWTYVRLGEQIQEQGISVINFFAHLPTLVATAGGGNFFYYIYNADSFRLFGAAYYAPVALNVTLTFVAAGFAASAARTALNLSPRLAAGLFVFTALAPDLLAWSTIMNGKDPLVLTGTMMAVYAVSQADTGRYGRALLLAVPVGFILFFTRYYVPVMLLAALVGANLMSRTGRRSPMLWLLVAGGLSAVIGIMGLGALSGALKLFQEHFVNPLYGIVRFALTPIPFHTDARYAFLNLPQVVAWSFMPLLIYGVIRVWRRRTLTSRFVVIYFLLMMLLYGMFEALQGPRHRVQIDALIALFQFFGFVGFFRQIAAKRLSGGQRVLVNADSAHADTL